MLMIHPEKHDAVAVSFCNSFLSNIKLPRYVLGRNEYAASIAELVELEGFIDDFVDDSEWLGKPVLKTEEIPKKSFVVSANVLGRPLTALKRLENQGVACIDYFKFLKYSGLPSLKVIDVLCDGKTDIKKNTNKYQWVYTHLEDHASKVVFERLVNFRFSYDLDYMQRFVRAQDRQYFENFLILNSGDVFIDAGGFDGQTSMEFIKRCPEYGSIHIFEPDPLNLELSQKNLTGNPNINFYTMGLAETQNTLRFSSGDGAASKICETGGFEIQVDALDNLVKEPISFVKMDIEGAEGIALKGSKGHIQADHPQLAICCYHKPDDFWRIPEQVLEMREDYAIYLRHYTEGITETVMYFIPRS